MQRSIARPVCAAWRGRRWMPESGTDGLGFVEATDSAGHRAAIYGTRLSVYGKPSMNSDDGLVAIGVDLPEHWVEAIYRAELERGIRL